MHGRLLTSALHGVGETAPASLLDGEGAHGKDLAALI
jgi:hypothetical protein